MLQDHNLQDTISQYIMRLGIHHWNVAWSGVKRRYDFLNKIPNNRLDMLKLIICCPIITHWIINWPTLMIMSLQIGFRQPKCIMEIDQLQFYPLFCWFHRERCGDGFWSTQIVHLHKNKLYMNKKIKNLNFDQSILISNTDSYVFQTLISYSMNFFRCVLFVSYFWLAVICVFIYICAPTCHKHLLTVTCTWGPKANTNTWKISWMYDVWYYGY